MKRSVLKKFSWLLPVILVAALFLINAEGVEAVIYCDEGATQPSIKFDSDQGIGVLCLLRGETPKEQLKKEVEEVKEVTREYIAFLIRDQRYWEQLRANTKSEKYQKAIDQLISKGTKATSQSNTIICTYKEGGTKGGCTKGKWDLGAPGLCQATINFEIDVPFEDPGRATITSCKQVSPYDCEFSFIGCGEGKIIPLGEGVPESEEIKPSIDKTTLAEIFRKTGDDRGFFTKLKDYFFPSVPTLERRPEQLRAEGPSATVSKTGGVVSDNAKLNTNFKSLIPLVLVSLIFALFVLFKKDNKNYLRDWNSGNVHHFIKTNHLGRKR